MRLSSLLACALPLAFSPPTRTFCFRSDVCGPRYHLPSGKNPEPVFPHPFPWEESAHFRPLPLVCSSVNVYDKNTACAFERPYHSGNAMRSVLRDKNVVEKKTLLVKRKKTSLAKRKKDFGDYGINENYLDIYNVLCYHLIN